MTDTERELQKRYGTPTNPLVNVPDSRSIAEVFESAKKNAVKRQPEKAEITDERVLMALIQDYQQQVTFRNRQFVRDDSFNEYAKIIVDWIMGGKTEYPWLYLSGSVGNGKSTFGRSATNILRYLGHKTAAKSGGELAQLYRQLDVSKRAYEEWRAICYVPILYIDDLEIGKWLDEVVEVRYNQMLPTIISTNIEFAALENQVSAKIYDRFLELTTEVIFTRESFRRKRQ